MINAGTSFSVRTIDIASETVFYTLALYFGNVGIKKARFAVPAALLSLLTSVVTGLLFSSLFFSP